MTIRYKNQYQKHLIQSAQLSKRNYHPNNHQNKINPQLVSQRSQKQASKTIPYQYVTSKNSNILKEKQQNIRSIDQKINMILQKHKNKDLTQIEPQVLDLKNQYERQYIKYAHKHSRKQSQLANEVKQKGQKSENMNCSPLRSNRIKQECLKIRQRSLKLFKNKQNYKNYEITAFLCDKDESNPKYDSQIEQLSRRIKKAQQNKKKLNIEYSPFHFISKSKSNNKAETSRSISNIKNHQSVYHQLNQQKQQRKINQFTLNRQISTSRKCGTITKNKVKQVQLFNQEHHNHKSQLYTFDSLPSNSDCQSNAINNLQTDLQSLKTNEEQPTNIKIFMASIEKQIQLDLNLRNYKIWLTFCRMPNKWNILQEAILQKKIQIPIQGIREIFLSKMQEHNIFFRWENVCDQQGIQLLLKAYQQAENHWATNIDKMLTVQFFSLLKKKMNKFDLQSIMLEDFLRFLNERRTKQLYTNRDIYLIYRRLLEKSGKINSLQNVFKNEQI